jgi:hypothetical protein
MAARRSQPERRQRCALGPLSVLLLYLVGAPALAENAGAAPEVAVKAAYLAKFGNFVEWPAGAFPTAGSPLVLCIAGDSAFGPALEQTTSGQRMGPRAIEVRRLDRADASAGCNILYLAGSRRQSVAEALKLMRGAPVLTVTDDEHPGPRGIIHFMIRNHHVRFAIDADMAALSHLDLSSKLLSVAESVRSRR